MPQVWRFDNSKFIEGGTSYLVDSQFGLLLCKTDGGAITINLAPLRESGMWGQDDSWLLVHDYGNNASVNNITINAGAGDTVNGASSYTLTTNGESALLIPSQLFTWSVIGGGAGAGGGSCRLVQVTVAQLRALVAVSGLNICWTYEITDSDSTINGNYMVDKIRMEADSNNTFAEMAQGLYWYPDYKLDGITTSTIVNQWLLETGRVALGLPAINVGDVYIFQGIRYRNLTGTNTDTTPDSDLTNWLALTPSLANGYIQYWNTIKYLLSEDMVIYRNEHHILYNVGVGDTWFKPIENSVSLDTLTLFIYGVNNINVFQWGASNGVISFGTLINFENTRTADNTRVSWGGICSISQRVFFFGAYVGVNTQFTIEGLTNAGGLQLISAAGSIAGAWSNQLNCRGAVIKNTTFQSDAISGGTQTDMPRAYFNNCDFSIASINLADSTFEGVYMRFTSPLTGHSIQGSSWGKTEIVVDIDLTTGLFVMDGSIVDGGVTIQKFEQTYPAGNVSASRATIMSINQIEFIGMVSINDIRIGKRQHSLMFAGYGAFGVNYDGAIIEGTFQPLNWILYQPKLSRENRVDVFQSNIVFELRLTGTPAYNALTTYVYGDQVDDGTGDIYFYISLTPASGNAPSNPSFWIRIYTLSTLRVDFPQASSYTGIIRISGDGEIASFHVTGQPYEPATKIMMEVVTGTVILRRSFNPVAGAFLFTAAAYLKLEAGDNYTFTIGSNNALYEVERNIYGD